MYSAAMYTPTPLPGGGQAKVSWFLLFTLAEADEQTEIEVILEESGGDEDRKRYKVTLTPANKIDMNAIVEYCQGAKQSEKAKDISVCPSSPSWTVTDMIANCYSSCQHPSPTGALREAVLPNQPWSQVPCFR
jgi:hypothetical protein